LVSRCLRTVCATQFYCANASSSMFQIHFSIAQQRPGRILFTIPFLNVPVTLTGIIGGLLGAALVASERFVDHWLLDNAVAILVCISTIGVVNLGSPAVGVTLLSGLFVYDIAMVFGTKMMQKVATTLDVPIKILFPVPGMEGKHSMLGLGDIVLPGAFLALLLRFDALRAGKWQPRSMALAEFEEKDADAENEADDSDEDENASSSAGRQAKRERSGSQSILLKPGTPGGSATQLSFFKPHFGLGMAYYNAGMITTLVAMHFMQHPQPALLYLVPALLFALVTSAIVMGDVEALWQYTEEVEIDDVESTADQPESKNGDSLASSEQTKDDEDSEEGKIRRRNRSRSPHRHD